MDHIFIDCNFRSEVDGKRDELDQLCLLEEQLRTTVLKLISIDSRLPKFEPCMYFTIDIMYNYSQ